jgi:hypothetical protein
MSNLGNALELPRCPHCGVDRPMLNRVHTLETDDHQQKSRRFWSIFVCRRCGGVVTAASYSSHSGPIAGHYPQLRQAAADEAIPERAREYLHQAYLSGQAPAGAVMLAASAVDWMLKEKSFLEGSLYSRIEQAAANGVITREMAQWAHQIRLDANDQRHADINVGVPTTNDARRTLEFAAALADFMFVLPSRVSRGLAQANGS